MQRYIIMLSAGVYSALYTFWKHNRISSFSNLPTQHSRYSPMKALYLIGEDGTLLFLVPMWFQALKWSARSAASDRFIWSINWSVLRRTEPLFMTYPPWSGNYGIVRIGTSPDEWLYCKKLSRIPKQLPLRTQFKFLEKKMTIPGICGIDTRTLTKLLREKFLWTVWSRQNSCMYES